MSRDALRDAYNAGYEQALDDSGGQCRRPDDSFDQWWQRSVDTLDRSPADDDWVYWDGSAKYPPGLRPYDRVKYKSLIDGQTCFYTQSLLVQDLRWTWAEGVANITAYKVVKP